MPGLRTSARCITSRPTPLTIPGGKGELLRGAGKDSAQLFQEIHPWVNWEGILGECLVGILVSENDIQTENALDAMD